MTSRWIGRMTIVLVTWACAVPATADGPADFFLSFKRDFERRNCWPEPFAASDRQAVREPVMNCVANGWQQQNMLSDPHFEVGGGQLTEAGRLRARWIANDELEQHRVVYVHRGATPQETAARIEGVRQYLAQVNYAGPVPPVIETNRSDAGYPADRADAISRRFQQALPDPKLPAAGGGSSGGSSGGGH